MRLSILFVVILSSFELFAVSNDLIEYDFEARLAEYWIGTEVEDTSLSDGMSSVTLASQNFEEQDGLTLLYGYNGTSFTKKMDGRPMDFKLPSGKYVFSFYLKSDQDYAEITTDSIEVKNGINTTIHLNFFIIATYQHSVRKPVIYLYPEEKTEVTVKVAPKGEMTFTYPTYTDGWKCIAEPNGDITLDGKKYNYLFWESEQNFGETLVDASSGFIVSGANITEFLDSKLSSIGFTGEERADFVTFWAPLMVHHDELFIHFMVNDQCNAFAELEIEPVPHHIARLYILWSPLPNDFNRTSLKEQKLPLVIRKGFTVLEWGGAEIDANLLNSN
ncbi:MAG: hypothetical protein ACI865_002088 [Flavobacteriaceae bacterium]|jgi:hypothetical protein